MTCCHGTGGGSPPVQRFGDRGEEHHRAAEGRSDAHQVSALLDSIPKEKLGQLLEETFKGPQRIRG